MGAHSPDGFYQAILTRIAAASLTVGDNEAPASTATPYVVLYDLEEDDDPETYGTLTDPHTGTIFRFQVTSVGASPREARWAQAKVRTQLIAWSPSVTGLTCGQVERDGGIGVQRDDNTKPVRYYAADRFACFASSST